ncbi:MAG: hypothetical protein ACI8XZ_000213 [Gammaproteobacteria bacterium]|jgi:hypothetical protein
MRPDRCRQIEFRPSFTIGGAKLTPDGGTVERPRSATRLMRVVLSRVSIAARGQRARPLQRVAGK